MMIEWKRYRACLSCRKAKARCEYDGPESETCMRCSKRELKCVQQTPAKGGHMSNAIVAFQSAGGKQYMKEECRDQIAMSGQGDDFDVSSLTIKQLKRTDCVGLAIELGLFTVESVRLFFELYMSGMSIVMPMGLSDAEELDTMLKERPVLALTLITSCSICTTRDKAVGRLKFLERILVERAFVDKIATLEICQSLLIGAHFVCINTYDEYDRSKVWQNAALNISRSIRLEEHCLREIRAICSSHMHDNSDDTLNGSIATLTSAPFLTKSNTNGNSKPDSQYDGVRLLRECPMGNGRHSVILSSNGTDVTKHYPLSQRVNLLLNIHSANASTCYHSGDKNHWNAFDSCREITDWSVEQNDPVILLSACVCKAIYSGHEMILELMEFKAGDVNGLLEQYDTAYKIMNSVRENARRVVHGPLLSTVAKFYELVITKCDLELLSCQEVVLGRLVAIGARPDQQVELTSTIKEAAISIINKFIEMTIHSARFPKFIYFRPLQAFTSLIRLKILNLCGGSKFVTIDSSLLLENLNKVNECWLRLKESSILAEQAYREYFLTVEAWTKLILDADEKLRNKKSGNNRKTRLSQEALQYFVNSIQVTASVPRAVAAAVKDNTDNSDEIDTRERPTKEAQNCPQALVGGETAYSDCDNIQHVDNTYSSMLPNFKRARIDPLDDVIPPFDYSPTDTNGESEIDYNESNNLLQMLFYETCGDLFSI